MEDKKQNDAQPPANEAGGDERMANQQALADKLAEEYKKAPTPDLLLQLNRKKDTVLHLKNIAKGSPRERARAAAEKARSSTLSKAVTQPLNLD